MANAPALSTRRLIDARERARMTQNQAAAASGLSRATIQNAELGRNIPSAGTLVTLARLYGCSLDWLFPPEAGTPAPAPASGDGPPAAGASKTATRRRAR